MVASIERYGAPFTIGTLLFLAQIWLNHGEGLFDREKLPRLLRQYGVQLCFILFVALTANYRAGCYGLAGYREDLEEQRRERETYVDEKAKAFLDTVQILQSDPAARVYYLRGADTPRFHDVYTGYLAAPVSVVYREIDLDEASAGLVLGDIAASHASYFYAEETAAGGAAILDAKTENEPFSCGVLYRVTEAEGTIRMTRVSQTP